MLAIGNDVVDLVEVRPEGVPPAFVRRVCTPDERLRIEASQDPVVALWRTWTGKEAAFKVAQRLDEGVAFAHRSFEVDVVRQRVSTPLGEMACRWSAHGREGRRGRRGERALACVAWMGPQAPFRHTVECHSAVGGPALGPRERRSAVGEPSRAARSLAKSLIAEHTGIAPDALEIPRSPTWVRRGSRWGAPEAWCGDGCLDGLCVSLSHHGAWVAAALSWEAVVRVRDGARPRRAQRRMMCPAAP